MGNVSYRVGRGSMSVWFKRVSLGIAILGLVLAAPAAAQNGRGNGNGGSEAAGVAGAGVGEAGQPVVLRPTGPVSGQFIVVFQDDITNPRGLANALARQNGFSLRGVYTTVVKGFSARMPAAVAERLSLDPDVAYVEQDVYVHADELVTGVDRIDAETNATAGIDGLGGTVNVDVAVIDTGIAPHGDLNIYRFYDCIGGCSGNGSAANAYDDNGHGSHVAGTIGALDDGVNFTISGTDYEVVGVAPGARLWGFKVLNAAGSGFISDIIAAVDKVTELGVIKVANMSLGGQAFVAAFRTAIQNSVGAGVVHVVSAGNAQMDIYGPNGVLDERLPMVCPLFGRDCPDDIIPASYPEAMAVSAMADSNGTAGGDGTLVVTFNICPHDGDDVFACFTNYSQSVDASNPVVSPGAAIDVAGPGVRILSTWNGEDGVLYERISGTSMASPHVAGAVALCIIEDCAMLGGPPSDAADVAAIRQAIIDGAQLQGQWGPVDTKDPDSNAEGLVYVGGDVLGDPPAVSWVNPNGLAPVSGNVQIEISASDTEDDPDGSVGALLVQWSDDGGATWKDTTFDNITDTYKGNDLWVTTGLADGDYTLKARAIDLDTNESLSNVIVTVDNVDDPPAVSWVNPDGLAPVSGDVEIEIAASDTEEDPDGSVGGLLVQWSDDGGATWKDTTFDNITDTYKGNDLWVTTALADGDYTLKARAIDSIPNETIQDVVVTVSNTPPVLVVSITYAGEGGRNGTKHLNSEVTVQNNGSPVSGASVNATVDRIDTSNIIVDSRTETGVTDSNGVVVFSWKNANSDCYETHVNSVDTEDMTGQTPANSIDWPNLFSEADAWCDEGTVSE